MGLTRTEQPIYIGFWLRVVASLIDSVLLAVVLVPLLLGYYGWDYFESDNLLKGPMDFVISWALPAAAILIFWVYRSATPGKMVIGAKIVDAETFHEPQPRLLVGRYFAYYISMLPFIVPLGFLWIAFDRRKQGWHDKLAGTVVVRSSRK